jgi:hypothetical protein
MRAYYTLNHSGVKIDYISEKQLAEGKGKDYKMIIVPEAETLRDDAFEGIKSLPASTRVFVMGECFTRNEYGKQRDPEQIKALKDKSSVLTDGDIEKIIWPQMRKALADAGAASEYSVVDAKSGEPIWGLEWLPAKVGSRTVINMVNYVNTPRNVKILRSGKEVAAYDLFSIGGREKVSTVKVLTPVLAEVK